MKKIWVIILCVVFSACSGSGSGSESSSEESSTPELTRIEKRKSLNPHELAEKMKAMSVKYAQEWIYELKGGVIQRDDKELSVIKELNAEGYVIKEEYKDFRGRTSRMLMHEYDTENNLIKTVEYDSDNEIEESAVYSYDNGKLLMKELYDQDGAYDKGTAYEYNKYGLVTKTLVYGEKGGVVNRTDDYYYDDNYDLILIESKHGDGEIFWKQDFLGESDQGFHWQEIDQYGDPVRLHLYRYGNDGLMTYETEDSGNEMTDFIMEYTYDPPGVLKTSTWVEADGRKLSYSEWEYVTSK